MGHFPAGGGGGSGTITDITSVDHTVTIVDPTGPTTDLSVPGASGTVTAVDSPDNSLAVTSGTTTPHLRGGVPAGDRTSITTPLAYTDPVSGDAIQVLTFSEDTTALALALTGDTFPQLIMRPGLDAGAASGLALAMGDGTFDPAEGGGKSFTIANGGNNPANGKPVWTLDGSQVYLELNGNVGNINEQVVVDQLSIGSFNGASGNPVTVQVCAGNPNTLNVPGNLNDVCINTAAVPFTAGWIWQCTTAGASGVAVWTDPFANPTVAANLYLNSTLR